MQEGQTIFRLPNVGTGVIELQNSVDYERLIKSGSTEFELIVDVRVSRWAGLLHTASGVPVAQWVKHWPADLAVLGSILAGGGCLFNCKWDSFTLSFKLSLSHHPDIFVSVGSSSSDTYHVFS